MRAQRRVRRRLTAAVQQLQLLYAEPKWDIGAWSAEVRRAEQQVCSALRKYIEHNKWSIQHSQHHVWVLQQIFWQLSPEYLLHVSPSRIELVKKITVGVVSLE
jgi:hypothetical protein